MDKELHLLLSIVDKNAGVEVLIDQGLNYGNIAILIETAIKSGYIVSEESDIKLSGSGKEKLAELRGQLKKLDKDTWIERKKDAIITKLDPDFIYLPNQKELYF